MKVAGIDLAGNPKNPTGFCVLEVEGEKKTVSTCILKTDEDIIKKLRETSPALVAVDAPLTYSGTNRRCDEELHEYGALPVTLRGMEVLALRGTALGCKIKEAGFPAIEVYSTASAKILGFYDRAEGKMQKKLLDAGVAGCLEKRLLVKDELDAVYAALTAYLHKNGLTEEVGDDEGKIVVPKV